MGLAGKNSPFAWRVSEELKQRYNNSGKETKDNVIKALTFTLEIQESLYTPELTAAFTNWLANNKEQLKNPEVYKNPTHLININTNIGNDKKDLSGPEATTKKEYRNPNPVEDDEELDEVNIDGVE